MDDMYRDYDHQEYYDDQPPEMSEEEYNAWLEYLEEELPPYTGPVGFTLYVTDDKNREGDIPF